MKKETHTDNLIKSRFAFRQRRKKKIGSNRRLAAGRLEIDFKKPLIYSQICLPKRGAKPRARRLIQYGGVCWTKSEPILNKIPTDCRPAGGRTKTERSGGQKERGLGGRNFCPPSLSPLLFSPPQFFVFRRAKSAAERDNTEELSMLTIVCRTKVSKRVY